jgi:hypothetical protein
MIKKAVGRCNTAQQLFYLKIIYAGGLIATAKTTAVPTGALFARAGNVYLDGAGQLCH